MGEDRIALVGTIAATREPLVAREISAPIGSPVSCVVCSSSRRMSLASASARA